MLNVPSGKLKETTFMEPVLDELHTGNNYVKYIL